MKEVLYSDPVSGGALAFPNPAGGPQDDRPIGFGENLQMASENAVPDRAVDKFWPRAPVEIARWNAVFPYQLLVVRAVADHTGNTVYRVEPGWRYTLPFPPESLTETLPFATTVTATLDGVFEDNNGLVFRNFVMRGNLGHLPARGTVFPESPIQTVAAIVGGFVDRVAIRDDPGVPGVHTADEFEHTDTDSGPDALLAKTTGYYQVRMMKSFFEAYAAVKQQRDPGRDLHLAFANWKDQAVYLVTPVSLEVSRSVPNGFGRNYSLSMKAWQRIVLDASGDGSVGMVAIRDDEVEFARVLRTMAAARRSIDTLGAALDAVEFGLSEAVKEPVREGVLFMRSLKGLGATIADMPEAVRRDMAAPWIQLQSKPRQSQLTARERGDVAKTVRALGASAAAETVPGVPVNSNHPAVTAVSTPLASMTVMESTSVDDMSLPFAVQAKVRREIAGTTSLRPGDFATRRDKLRATTDRFASSIGAGDPTVAAVYGYVAPATRTPSDSEMSLLWAMEDAVSGFDALSADPAQQGPSALGIVAGLARRSGLAFQEPRSKFMVPFPYGATLESLAETYLGTADRAPEIAALNGLRSPFVDEEGFSIPLVVNGAGNAVVVRQADVQDRLFAGQLAHVSSRVARRTARRVLEMRRIDDLLYLYLSGDEDMGNYKLFDGAVLEAFLPDTVNSQMTLWIPSQAEPREDGPLTKSIPGIDAFDPLVAAGGVDLLLTPDNDLVLGPDNDARFVAGLANLVQILRVWLSIKKGKLLRHPEIGLQSSVGTSSADSSAKDDEASIRRMLADDSAFTRVDRVKVTRSGPINKIDVSVLVAGTQQPVAVSFQAS